MTTEALNPSEHSRQAVEQYLQERMTWVADAVELICGSREADPREILSEPAEVRSQSEGLKLNDEQEAKLREISGRFGIGGEADVVSYADDQITEGGKPWKVEGEIEIAKQHAKTLILAAAKWRDIGQDETSYMEEKLKAKAEPVGKTEYDMVRQLAELQGGFVALEEDEVLPYGYDINNNYALLLEPTGQFIKIGELEGCPVILLSVDQNTYFDEAENKIKPRDRPDAAALMGIVSDVRSVQGDEASSVAINSSTTYASRAVDTVRAGLKRGRSFSVGMYGRQTLADIRGLEVAEPSEINQIPGELRVMYDKLLQLKADLSE